MNVLEMHTAIQLELDKSSSYQLAAFEPEEIDFWLNEGQTELVKRKAFGNNYRQEGMSDSVKRMEDLTPLIKTITFASANMPVNAAYSNVRSASNTSTDYMFFVSASVKFSTSKSSEAQLVKITDIKNLVVTDYNIPFLRNPFVYITEKKFNFIIDPYSSVTSSTVTYIKTPLTLVRSGAVSGISTTVSELPTQAHNELVALTTFLMLENIESTRLQSNQIILNNKE